MTQEQEIKMYEAIVEAYEKKLFYLMGAEFFDYANLVKLKAFTSQFPEGTVFYVEDDK